MIDFVVSVYTNAEDEGSASVCLKTNNGNDEAITVIVSTDHITTSSTYIVTALSNTLSNSEKIWHMYLKLICIHPCSLTRKVYIFHALLFFYR